MIDIHSHILPGIDDGAKDLDEAVAMCRASYDDGITTIVATPHAHDSVHPTHQLDFLKEKVEELRKALGGTPNIALGCELRITHDIVNQVCIARTAPTIGSGPYILVEFPHYVVPAGSQRVFFELLTHDVRPIVAHPERNRTFMAEPERFYEMVDNGVLGQIDSGSVTGQFGSKVKETAMTLLENGLVHFLASDCHNMRNRLPGMSTAVAEIEQVLGRDLARSISVDNPAAIVKGDSPPFRPSPQIPVKPRKKKFFFF